MKKLIPLSKFVIEQDLLLNSKLKDDSNGLYEKRKALEDFSVSVVNYTRFVTQPISVDILVGENKLFEEFELQKGDPEGTDCYTTYLLHETEDIFVAYKKSWEKDWVFLETIESIISKSEITLTYKGSESIILK